MIKPNLLKRFYEDEEMRKEFKDFQLSLLEKIALEAVFAKKDISGMAEARKVINDSFDKLEELYAKVEKSEHSSSR